MLARLSPADRAVVEALALLGDGAGPGVLAEVAGTDPEPALAAARRAGLLGAPTEDGTPFAHALLQDGVRAAVPPAAAVPIHERAAGALSERLPRPGRRALAGRRPAPRRPPTARCGRPSRPAGRSPSTTRSGTCRTRPTRWLPPAPATPNWPRCWSGWPPRSSWPAASRTARPGREAAADAATRAGRPDLRRPGRARAARRDQPVRGARGGVAVPAGAGRRPPTAVRARLLAELAAMAAENGDPADADRLAAEALRLAEQDGDPAAVLDAARARELTLLTADSVGERLRLGRLAIATAAEAGQPLSAVLGAGWQIRAGYQLARLDIVDEAFGVLGPGGRADRAAARPLAPGAGDRGPGDARGPVRRRPGRQPAGHGRGRGARRPHHGRACSTRTPSHLARLRGDRATCRTTSRCQFEELGETFAGSRRCR